MQAASHLIDVRLRDDVRLLGELLGEVIAEDRGPAFLASIEHIRALAKAARQQGGTLKDLSDYLRGIADENLVDVTRAFNQFLNLANLADQHHQVREQRERNRSEFEVAFQTLLQRNVSANDIATCLAKTKVDLVLTAHPTEVLRRTMIQKYDALAKALDDQDRALSSSEIAELRRRMKRLIAEAWHTDEIREERPTPQDEARSAYAVIEHSLWHAVPQSMRALDRALAAAGVPLSQINPAVGLAPYRISAWMGGDRDGNPNVTAQVTREVLQLARWMAADLYLRDVDQLLSELSMSRASVELIDWLGDESSHEPYRVLLRQVRERLRATRDWAEDRLPRDPTLVMRQTDELLEPLLICYRSLMSIGVKQVASGTLLDTIRRCTCFGLNLIHLDVRQSSERHRDALDELTRHLGILNDQQQSYGQWSETEKQEFLLKELNGKRPLFPSRWPASPEVSEVMATCAVVAQERIETYVISMASSPSDVLGVILLMREAGATHRLAVVPLFETLDDLDNAAAALDALLSLPWYRQWNGDSQMVMIGYSDSAKDAGQLAAAWAQYRAQEALTVVAKKHGIHLTLFHGRGGAVGRGGGPSHAAILSQSPGSVDGSLRLTEQGEMIRFKLGQPNVAEQSLATYLTATLEATLLPPIEPQPAWRALMDRLADAGVKSYRQVVRGHPDFVRLFSAITPEDELATLAIGSRPARRKANKDIASLRAIPWVFSWTQIRLMLPPWLGTEAALALPFSAAERATLVDMMQRWPFFAMQMDMLEMVLAKVDLALATYYASRLIDVQLMPLLNDLCAKEKQLEGLLLQWRGHTELLVNDPRLQASLEVRNTYLDPLHVMQAELLARIRSPLASSEVSRALKVTMAGIASGMRNTG